MADVGATEIPEVVSIATSTAQEDLVATDNTFVILRTIVLIVLLIVSLVGNSLVVLAVALERKTRHNPFNAFILSVSSFGLLECALTISLATGFSIEQSWKFGDFLAGFNAAFVQLQNVGIMLSLCAMSVDRFIAVTRVSKYHTHSSVHHANYAVLYTWIQAFIFALPLLFQNQMLGVTARPFVERCLCGLVEGTSAAFVALLSILCFVIPLFVTMVFIHLVNSRASHERRKLKSNNTTGYATYCMQESMLLNEARVARFVTVLLLLYLVLKAPYVGVDILTQLDVPGAYYPVNNTSIVMDGSRFYYQTMLTWLMYCYSAIYPVMTLLFFHEHRRRVTNWMSCSTAPTSLSRGPLHSNPRRLRQKQRRHRRKIDQAKKRNQNQATAPPCVSSIVPRDKVAISGTSSGDEVLFRVPVLYAATDGLHLVASDKTIKFGDEVKRKRSDASNNNNNNSPCDVIKQPPDDVDEDFRSSSVVDKRVDVINDDVIDDVVYMTSDFECEESESELNASANSRTLIWPHSNPCETGIPLPHTPTPPPGEGCWTPDLTDNGCYGNKVYPDIVRSFVDRESPDSRKPLGSRSKSDVTSVSLPTDCYVATKHKSSKVSPLSK